MMWIRYDTTKINSDIPIEDVIERYAGIKCRGRENITCPSPQQTEHSAKIYHNICKCSTCNKIYTPISLAKEYYPDLGFPDLCQKLLDDFGLSKEYYSYGVTPPPTPDYKDPFPWDKHEIEKLKLNYSELFNAWKYKGKREQAENKISRALTNKILRCLGCVNTLITLEDISADDEKIKDIRDFAKQWNDERGVMMWNIAKVAELKNSLSTEMIASVFASTAEKYVNEYFSCIKNIQKYWSTETTDEMDKILKKREFSTPHTTFFALECELEIEYEDVFYDFFDAMKDYYSNTDNPYVREILAKGGIIESEETAPYDALSHCIRNHENYNIISLIHIRKEGERVYQDNNASKEGERCI